MRCAFTEEIDMLRIYAVSLDLVREVKPLVEKLERRDPDLARQCRKALASGPTWAELSAPRRSSRLGRALRTWPV